MSDPRFSIIPAGAVTDSNLEPRDLQVLCLFGRHIDDKGWCRRSQVKMAKEIGCARSTVQASIDRLVTAGWLEKRVDNDPHTPGIRASAFEYRVLLDSKDRPQHVVGTPADLSAPPADVSESEAVKAPGNMDRHPPAPPADPAFAGVSALQNGHLSAPRLTSPTNQKEARTRSGLTEDQAVVSSKVRVHSDDPVFRKIAELRGKHPPTDRDGFWSFPAEVVAQARKELAH